MKKQNIYQSFNFLSGKWLVKSFVVMMLFGFLAIGLYSCSEETDDILNNKTDNIHYTTSINKEYPLPIGTTYEIKDGQVDYTLPQGFTITNEEVENSQEFKGGPVTTIEFYCLCLEPSPYFSSNCDPSIDLSDGSLFCLSTNCDNCHKSISIRGLQSYDDKFYIKKQGKKIGQQLYSTILSSNEFEDLPWLANEDKLNNDLKSVFEEIEKELGFNPLEETTDEELKVLIPFQIGGQKFLFNSSLSKWVDSGIEFMYIGGGVDPSDISCDCDSINSNGQCNLKSIIKGTASCVSVNCSYGCIMNISLRN